MRAKTEVIDLIEGRWWKFSRYQLVEGYVEPAPGATLESYNPWDAYDESKLQTGGQPPYQSLLSLLSEVGADYSKGHWAYAEIKGGKPVFRAGIGVSPVKTGGALAESVPHDLFDYTRQLALLPYDAFDRITDWCSNHGLLGILPHLAESVAFPMRRGVEEDGLDDPDRWWVAVRYERSAGRWTSRKFPWYERAHVKEFAPGVRLRPIEDFGDTTPRLEERDLESGWWPFFPTLQGIPPKPLTPLTDDFWRVYAEPIDSFIRYALVFQQAIEPLSPDSELSKVIDAKVALRLLQRLIEPVGTSAVVGQDGKLRETWVCPSLISCFAKMALQDLCGGRKMLRCPCGKTFLTGAYQALYCSEQCGWRIRKRKARARSVREPATG